MKQLLESTELPLELLKKEPLVLAYATTRKQNEIISTAKSAGISIFHLKEPGFYLSPKKLAEKLSSEKISADEIPFLLKIILWNAETKAGDREEISLEREEYGLFETLADHEGKDVFWQKALEAAKGCSIVLIHQYALARNIIGNWSLEIGNSNLERGVIVLDAARLEDSFTNALKKKYTDSRLRPFFGEKVTMLFGLLGIFHERFSEIDAGGFRGNVILDENVRQSKEWKQFFSALENLPRPSLSEPSHPLGEATSLTPSRGWATLHPKKEEVIKDFLPQENYIQWISSYANEIAFSSAPLSLAASFHKQTEKFSDILLQSEALSGDGSFTLMRELFELDSSWKEDIGYRIAAGNDTGRKQGMRDNFEIKIPEDFPEPYSGGYFKRCEKLFLELIRERKGKCLFLMSSKKAVAATYQSLLPKMPEGVRLLAAGPTGGMGKSVALFLENPTNSALIVTNQILPHLEEIEDHIEVIVFQKIPFDPPDDPVLAARAKQFENGFEEYTLPRAIMRFREILGELRASAKNTPKTCYLLDSRLKNRDYGRLFL